MTLILLLKKRLFLHQVDGLIILMEAYRKQHQALLLAFPGSELDFGGCLATGKGKEPSIISNMWYKFP